MRNTIIFTAVLFVAVITASIFYFRHLDNEQNQGTKSLKLLPENTLLIVSLHNSEISDNIFKDFEVFDALMGFKNIETLSHFKNNILRKEGLDHYVNDTDIYFSFHPGKESIESLITIPTITPIAPNELPNILAKINTKYNISTSDTLGQKIYDLKYGSKDSVLHAIYYQDIIFASQSKDLLTKIIDRHAKHLPSEQIEFFLKNSSRNTPLSVYFPHQQYDSIINRLQKKASGPFLDQFRKLQGQSSWNINFKQDALILTGESELDQYSENYVSIFKNQQKRTQYLYNFFPANTALYLEYSISDRSKFQKDLKDLFKRRNEPVAQKIDTTLLSDNLQKAWGNEIAFIETTEQNYIGFIHLADSSIWKKIQSEVIDNTSDSTFRFKTSNILYEKYGDVFKEFTRPYLIQIDSMLVFANSSSTLRSYRQDWNTKNLLIGTLGFKNFEKLQGNDANVTLFMHNKNASSKISNSLALPFQENFKDTENFGYQDFYSWSVQLSGNNGNMSSQIYAMYKSKSALGVTPEWTIEFDNKALTRPYVFEHSDTSMFILLQELDHTLHAIHPSGKKLWSTVIAGRIVGDLQQLSDRSILFVTDKARLYRIDTEGKTLSGFSLGLPEDPIATPTIANIHGKKTILIPSKTRVSAYDLEGKQVQNWQTNEIADQLIPPILPLDNHFVVASESGKLYLLDDKGQKTKEIDLKENITLRNPVGVFNNNNIFHLLALDTSGYVYTIPVDKAPLKQKIGSLDPKYFGDFISITGNKMPELVIMDKSLLQLYNIQDSCRLIFEYNFTKDIGDRPQYFPSTLVKGQQYIGVASKATNLLYMFEEKGNVMDGFPVEGQPLFYYGKINYNSDTYLLTMRRDHKLYAFRHQK